MKKLFLISVATLLASSIFAQLPTISASRVSFKYCQTTFGPDENKKISLNSLPYTWHYNGEDFIFESLGTQVIATQNARGCDSIVMLTLSLDEGVIPHAYTVGNNRRVYFSRGNLQYCANPSSGPTTHATQDGNNTQGVWRFAEHQWDCVQVSNSVYYDNNGINTLCDNAHRSSNYAGWIDMFKWGTSGYQGFVPYTTLVFNYNSAMYADLGISTTNYSKSSVDWGWYNAISNGGDIVEKWFTLTAEEWNYLLNTRANALQKKGAATINSAINGYVILPDVWECPIGLSFSAGVNNNYSGDEWELMEEKGAVFLPASGTGYGATNGYAWASTAALNTISYYWTATRSGSSVNQFTCMGAPHPNAMVEVPNVLSDYLLPVRLVCDAP